MPRAGRRVYQVTRLVDRPRKAPRLQKLVQYGFGQAAANRVVQEQAPARSGKGLQGGTGAGAMGELDQGRASGCRTLRNSCSVTCSTIHEGFHLPLSRYQLATVKAARKITKVISFGSPGTKIC